MRTLCLLMAAGLSFGCHSNTPTNSASTRVEQQQKQPVSFSGRVIFKGLEGGFYAIYADDGRKFTPINLPDDFKKHDLKVEVAGFVQLGARDFRMHGQVLTIEKIKIISP